MSSKRKAESQEIDNQHIIKKFIEEQLKLEKVKKSFKEVAVKVFKVKTDKYKNIFNNLEIFLLLKEESEIKFFKAKNIAEKIKEYAGDDKEFIIKNFRKILEELEK